MKYTDELERIAGLIRIAKELLEPPGPADVVEVHAALVEALQLLNNYAVRAETDAGEVDTSTLKRFTMRGGMRVQIVEDPNLQNGECIIRDGDHAALVRFQDGLVYIVTGLPPKEVER